MPLSVFYVVEGHHTCVFFQSTRSNSSKFLHVGTTAEEVAQMNAKGSDVGASFAVNPDDTHVSFFVVLDETQLVD